MDRDTIINDNELSFRVLFYNNPQPMWIVEIETLRFLAVNNAAVNHYGYSRAEFLKGSLAQIRPASEQAEMLALIKKIKNNQTVTENITHVKKDGSLIFVNITSYTVNFKRARCRMVIINDVTTQRLKNEKLKAAWRKVRQTLESITDGFITLNNNLIVSYFNKEAENILKINRKNALNRKITRLFPELQTIRLYRALIIAHKQQQTVRLELYLSAVNKWISSTVYPNNNGFTVYFSDISNGKSVQSELDDNIRTLQDLAYLNSHMIRKDVANILGIVNLINGEADDFSNLKELIALLNSSANSLDGLIKEINSRIES